MLPKRERTRVEIIINLGINSNLKGERVMSTHYQLYIIYLNFILGNFAILFYVVLGQSIVIGPSDFE